MAASPSFDSLENQRLLSYRIDRIKGNLIMPLMIELNHLHTLLFTLDAFRTNGFAEKNLSKSNQLSNN